jgi:hypothetical protein
MSVPVFRSMKLPVGVLRIADVVRGLAERRCLLVAEVAGDRGAGQAPRRITVDVRRRPDVRQHRPRNAERAQLVLVPVQRLEVHQHCPAGVRDVGDVAPAVPAPGDVPDDPRVDVAEHEIPRLGPFPRPLDVVQDPLDLGPREIGRERESRLVSETILAAVAGQLGDDLLRSRVLPDERVVHGLTGVAVPDDRRLALIGDPDRR